MKIVIPGGSGQVGTLLARAFHAGGHEVVVLSRSPQDGTGWRMVEWDGENMGYWVSELEGADVLINLAGFTVNSRYNARNRERIMASRVNSTRLLGQALSQLDQAPTTWLQASTATIYAHTYDAAHDEDTGVLGGSEPKGLRDGSRGALGRRTRGPGAKVPKKWRFSVEVAQAWERALDEADLPQTRTVKMRSAMIMSPGPGGVFDTFLRLVRWGLGGRQGSGRQYVSWIHYEDFVRAVNFLLAHPELEGVVNVAAPNPLPNAEFMRALREAWGTDRGLHLRGWMLKLGAFFLRTETELVLKSRRVVPGRLRQAGFDFRFPQWEAAAQDLVRQWRE
jgi:hypothetical protein